MKSATVQPSTHTILMSREIRRAPSKTLIPVAFIDECMAVASEFSVAAYRVQHSECQREIAGLLSGDQGQKQLLNVQ